jgi:hypothetical protein
MPRTEASRLRGGVELFMDITNVPGQAFVHLVLVFGPLFQVVDLMLLLRKSMLELRKSEITLLRSEITLLRSEITLLREIRQFFIQRGIGGGCFKGWRLKGWRLRHIPDAWFWR